MNSQLNLTPPDAEKMVDLSHLDSTIRPHSESINNLTNEEHQPAACCLRVKIARPLLYVLPLAAALTESADVAKSLYKIKNKNAAIITTTTIISFLSSIGLTFEATTDNLSATCEIIKHRHLPQMEGWPKLTFWQEASAIALTTLPGIWSPLSTAMQAFYIIDALYNEYEFINLVEPKLWKGISGSIAFATGVSETLTNVVQTYRLTRKSLAGKPSDFSNTFSAFFSPIIGGILGFTNAIHKSVQNYTIIKNIFSVTHVKNKIMIAIPSGFNIIPIFCFEGIYLIKAMDEMFRYVAERKCEPIKIMAFSVSAAMSLYLACTLRPVDLDFYHEVANDMLGTQSTFIPIEILETLSWLMFTQRFLQTTTTFFEPMVSLFNRTHDKFTLFASYLKKAPNELRTQNIETPLLSVQETSLLDSVIVFDSNNETEENSPCHSTYCTIL